MINDAYKKYYTIIKEIKNKENNLIALTKKQTLIV